MADGAEEEIAHLEALASIWRQRLRLLDEQLGKVAGNPSAVAQLTFERDEADQELRKVLANLRRLRPGPVADRSPYLGLLTFQETHADLFFGRDALVAELVERARRAAFLAVLGASGSGKSSVVRAGLVPMLKGGALPGSETWRYVTLKPGARPLDTLAAALARLQGDPAAVVRYGEALDSGERALLLLADALLDRASGQRLVLVVDQFEELWTLIPAEAQQRETFLEQQQRPFIRLLLAASAVHDSPVLLILSMRADFLHRAAEDPALARMIGEHDLIVSPMTRDELREAITRPAELAGGSFEPGLVDELTAQVAGRPGALPLLEYTLAQLWEQREPDGTLTWQAYRALGGVEGALAVRADAILAERYTPEQQDELRQVLLRLVQPGEGAADTRRRVPLADLAPADGSITQVQALLQPLVDARLLVVTATIDDRPPTADQRPTTNDQRRTTTDEADSVSSELPSSFVLGPSSVQVEVAHEALIRAWPTLARWIGQARADLRFQLQLEAAAQEWQTSGENAGLLWSGLRLSNAAAWLERARPRLNARDQAFLDASRAAEQIREEAEEAARRRELAQAQALAEEQRLRAEEQIAARGRLRRYACFLAGALVVALAAAVVAGWFGVAAQRSATLALARQLVAQAVRVASGQPDRALLFGVEANKLSDEAQAHGALLGALVTNEHLAGLLRGHTAAVTSVVFSPDGMMLASASDDGTVRLWDVATRQPLGQPLQGYTNLTSVVFSPDGTMLASASLGGTIQLWNVATRRSLGQPLQGHIGPIYSVVFSPDGKTLASAGSGDGTILLWDVAARQPLDQPLQGHTNSVASVAFSPDGTTLVSAGFDGTVRLWDVATRQQLGQPLGGDIGSLYSVAFSPDGTTLASAGGDDSIRLWDVASRQPLGQPLQGHTGFVENVVFNPDGTTLASAGSDGTILLWDVATRQPFSQSLQGHTAAVTSVAFSPDGTTLASASLDNTIRLWDMTMHQPLGQPLQGNTESVWSVVFSPDGQMLASAGYDGTIGLWDVATRRLLGQPLQGHTDVVTSVAFNPDSKILASASRDGTIQLWDVAARQPLGQPLQGHTDVVTSVVFSPDGKTLASAGYDGTIRLWDVASRQPLGQPLSSDSGTGQKVAFSPDGKTLASIGYNGTIQLWDVASRQPLGQPLQGHTGFVENVAFSPDGTTLASAGYDRTVRLWDVASREPVGQPLQGHIGSVKSVAFSPDGTTLASASDDHTIRLWDVATRQPLGAPLQGHTAAVRSVAFSSDGTTLVSASDDHTIRLWDVSLDSWIARACRIAGRNLTQDEWNQFVSPDRPYHRTCPQFPPGDGAPANAP